MDTLLQRERGLDGDSVVSRSARELGVAHIAHCITFVKPIDRILLRLAMRLEGKELETFIYHEIITFCMKSQGKTGWQYASARKPRGGKLKSAARLG